MNFKTLLRIGIALIFVGATGMIYLHEFAISEIIFLIGIILAGYAYAQCVQIPDTKETPKLKVNTEQINKNIQTLNDILWGKEK